MTQTQETKHTPTPGPWTWNTYMGGDAHAAARRAAGIEPTMALNNDGGTYVMGTGELIAVVALQAAVKKKDLWHAEDGERDANARLIAAAPSLLAALEKIVIIANGAGGHGIMIQRILQEAQAAIDLAEKGA